MTNFRVNWWLAGTNVAMGVQYNYFEYIINGVHGSVPIYTLRQTSNGKPYEIIRTETLPLVLQKKCKLFSGCNGFIYIQQLSNGIYNGKPTFNEPVEIHHIDDNSLNNHPHNLIALPRSVHRNIHNGKTTLDDYLNNKKTPTKTKVQQAHYTPQLANKVLQMFYGQNKSIRHIKKNLHVHFNTIKKIIGSRFTNKNFNMWNTHKLINKLKKRQSTKPSIKRGLQAVLKKWILIQKIPQNIYNMAIYTPIQSVYKDEYIDTC